MNKLLEIIKMFFMKRHISFKTYFFMMLYTGIIFYFMYYLIEINRKKDKFSKKNYIKDKKNIFQSEYQFRYKFILNLKRKYNISPVILKRNAMTFEGFLTFNIIFFTAISMFILFMLKKFLLLSIFPGILVGGLLTVICINLQYEKRKRNFEKAFPEIGLTINQNIQNLIVRKELREIFKRIILLGKDPVSEEFSIIAKDYENNHDITRALNNITYRYPDSQYLPRLKDIFEIYYETKEDISDIVNITVEQVRNYEEIKKKTEIEIAPYIRIIYSIWFIGYSFLVLYLATNKLTRIFYKSRYGIVALIILNFIMILGIVIIEYLKLEVSKDEYMQRLE